MRSPNQLSAASVERHHEKSMLRRSSPAFRSVVALFGVAAALAASTACSPTKTEDIATDAITASFDVLPRADGSATDVLATLSAGSLTPIELTGDDKVVARSGEKRVELSTPDELLTEEELDASEAAGEPSFYGRTLNGVLTGVLDGVGAEGDVVTVAFERTAFPSAPSSTVTLPAPVQIVAPEAAAVFSRANDDIVVTLAESASTDPVRVTWSGECIDDGNVDVPAGQNTITIARSTIARIGQGNASGGGGGAAAPVSDSCELRLVVERVVDGVLDDAWDSGRITATTSDSRDLTSNP